jgi:hypothetical protein
VLLLLAHLAGVNVCHNTDVAVLVQSLGAGLSCVFVLCAIAEGSKQDNVYVWVAMHAGEQCAAGSSSAQQQQQHHTPAAVAAATATHLAPCQQRRSHCAQFWRAGLIAAAWHCGRPAAEEMLAAWVVCSSAVQWQLWGGSSSQLTAGARALAIPDATGAFTAPGIAAGATPEQAGTQTRLSCAWATEAAEAVRPDRDIADAIVTVWCVKKVGAAAETVA